MKHFLRRISLAIIFFLSIVSCIVCKDQISGGDLSSIVFPAAGVHYSTVQNLFNVGCGGQSSSCHGYDTFQAHGGFSLDAYEHVMYTTGIVVRSDPSHSLLINVVEGTTAPKMPPTNQPQLNDNQKKGLRTWVAEGARAD
jgi:hypothetical protein